MKCIVYLSFLLSFGAYADEINFQLIELEGTAASSLYTAMDVPAKNIAGDQVKSFAGVYCYKSSPKCLFTIGDDSEVDWDDNDVPGGRCSYSRCLEWVQITGTLAQALKGQLKEDTAVKIRGDEIRIYGTFTIDRFVLKKF